MDPSAPMALTIETGAPHADVTPRPTGARSSRTTRLPSRRWATAKPAKLAPAMMTSNCRERGSTETRKRDTPTSPEEMLAAFPRFPVSPFPLVKRARRCRRPADLRSPPRARRWRRHAGRARSLPLRDRTRGDGGTQAGHRGAGLAMPLTGAALPRLAAPYRPERAALSVPDGPRTSGLGPRRGREWSQSPQAPSFHRSRRPEGGAEGAARPRPLPPASSPDRPGSSLAAPSRRPFRARPGQHLASARNAPARTRVER